MSKIKTKRKLVGVMLEDGLVRRLRRYVFEHNTTMRAAIGEALTAFLKAAIVLALITGCSTTTSHEPVADVSTDATPPITQIAFWGDSLSLVPAPGGHWIPFPTQLATLTGVTEFNGSINGGTSIQIRVAQVANTAKHSWPAVIWAGRNDFFVGDGYADTTVAQVESNIATMVADLTTTQYIVVGIINDNIPQEWLGTNGHNKINQLNADLSATYGSHYVNLRERLVAQYNPAIPQDVIDHNHDVGPTSLSWDGLHLNTTGFGYVAAQVILGATPFTLTIIPQ